MRFPREFWIPKQVDKKIDRPDLAAVVFYPTVISGGKHLAMGFHGKAAKPDFHYSFKTEQERDAYVDRYFDNLAANRKRKEEYKASAKLHAQAFLESLKPGVILSDSWGYEQTQVEFYQVVERKGSKVCIQEMGAVTVPGSEGRDCRRVMPGAAFGPKIWKVVRGQSIKIESCIALTLWDGKSCYNSWYY